MGNLPLSQKQGSALGVEPGKRISPYLELCCLRISANVSYADAASDVAMLTGIEVSSKTQQRLVQAYDFSQPKADTAIQEACVDGGKVRLRTPLGQECVWRDYKAIATDQGTGAFACILKSIVIGLSITLTIKPKAFAPLVRVQSNLPSNKLTDGCKSLEHSGKQKMFRKFWHTALPTSMDYSL